MGDATASAWPPELCEYLPGPGGVVDRARAARAFADYAARTGRAEWFIMAGMIARELWEELHDETKAVLQKWAPSDTPPSEDHSPPDAALLRIRDLLRARLATDPAHEALMAASPMAVARHLRPNPLRSVPRSRAPTREDLLDALRLAQAEAALRASQEERRAALLAARGLAAASAHMDDPARDEAQLLVAIASGQAIPLRRIAPPGDRARHAGLFMAALSLHKRGIVAIRQPDFPTGPVVVQLAREAPP